MWYDKIVAGQSGPQVINDSKTPSGRVHVGSLRGVLIHDAIYRAFKDAGIAVTYRYGIDDFDPLDGLPADAGAPLKEFMGQPLCNIPAPDGQPGTDLADHTICEFLGIFAELGVAAEVYRMRDVYRSGEFNQAIDTILGKAEVVRRIYAQVSKAERPANWFPFQVICEQCAKIGTTEVTDYDGKEVTYTCRPDLVTWATGCGYAGKLSPFDGNGKLPWKLEWAAKWHSFGITVEGAGKDHCTKGGSRDVAVRCLREIFGDTPPLNVPYEFFLVSGAKMSSSKGIGTAAREMADFLPPEILRFLMIRTPPKRTVNFSTDLDYIVRLFNEHDRLTNAHLAGRANAEQQQTLRTVAVQPQPATHHPVAFQLLTALLQLPHIDVEAEVAKRSENELSEAAIEDLRRRIAAAQYWLQHYASEDDKIELQQDLPTSAAGLSNTQRAFLRLLGERLPEDPGISEDAYQTLIFDCARLTPIDQKAAFAALYCVLLDKDQGPKGGALLSYLQRDFLQRRFSEVDYSRDKLWAETGLDIASVQSWFQERIDKLASIQASASINILRQPTESGIPISGGQRGLELRVTLTDNKTHRLRLVLPNNDAGPFDLDTALEQLQEQGNVHLEQIRRCVSVTIADLDRPSIYEEGLHATAKITSD